MSRGFLLDTNLISEQTRARPEPRVEQWIDEQQASIFLSAITVGEIRKGIALLPQSNRRSSLEQWLNKDLLFVAYGRVLPVTRDIAERWGFLSAVRQRMGKPLGIADGLIAATAMEHDLTLVTRNIRDFTQLSLRLFDPWNSQR